MVRCEPSDPAVSGDQLGIPFQCRREYQLIARIANEAFLKQPDCQSRNPRIHRFFDKSWVGEKGIVSPRRIVECDSPGRARTLELVDRIRADEDPLGTFDRRPGTSRQALGRIDPPVPGMGVEDDHSESDPFGSKLQSSSNGAISSSSLTSCRADPRMSSSVR